MEACFLPVEKWNFIIISQLIRKTRGFTMFLQKKVLAIDQFYKIGNYQEFQYHITDNFKLGKLSDWVMIFYNRLLISCLIHGPEEESSINSQLE